MLDNIDLQEIAQLIIAIILLVILGELLRTQSEIPEWLVWAAGSIVLYYFGKAKDSSNN